MGTDLNTSLDQRQYCAALCVPKMITYFPAEQVRQPYWNAEANALLDAGLGLRPDVMPVRQFHHVRAVA